MNAEQTLALAERAYQALQAASPKPLDMVIILSDGEDIAASSQLLASAQRGLADQGDHLRRQLQLHCAAMAMIVEQAEEPELLLQEIVHVIRREAFGEGKPS